MQENLPIVADGHPTSLSTLIPKAQLKSHGKPLARELSQLLMPHPENSYLFRISGHSWADQGILDGDIAVVERKRVPQPSDLVISWHDSGFSVCRQWQLLPENESIGVVTAVIHPYGQ